MILHRVSLVSFAFVTALAVAACGGSAAALPSAPASLSPSTAAGAKPSAAASAVASAKPAASVSASVNPAASSAAGAKPAASGPASPSVAVSAADKPEVPKVTVVYGTSSGAQIPLWLGAEQGLFQKYGLTVAPEFTQSTAGVQAVASGKAEFFVGQGTSAFQAEAQGTPLKIIAYDQQFNNLSLMVRPEIANASDLKGKPVSISAAGDSTDLSVRIALTPLGIDVAKDVTLVPGGTSNTRVAALETGKVAAAVLSEPFITQAKKDGMKVLVDMSKSRFISGGITVNGDWAKQNPKTTVAFLKGLEEGIRYVTDPKNKDVAIASLAKNLKDTPDSATVQDSYSQYAGGALAHDIYPEAAGGDAMLVALKSMDPSRFDKLTTSQVLDPQYMEQLRSSGFLKQLWGNDL